MPVHRAPPEDVKTWLIVLRTPVKNRAEINHGRQIFGLATTEWWRFRYRFERVQSFLMTFPAIIMRAGPAGRQMSGSRNSRDLAQTQFELKTSEHLGLGRTKERA